MKQDLKNLSFEELQSFITRHSVEPYRANQIFQWMYREHVHDFSEMTNISKALREKFEEVAWLRSMVPEKTDISMDGSKKFLFKTHDGHGLESVLIPERNHFTLCISTQIGCPVRCRFCYTGRNGLIRNLSASEIVCQVSAVLKEENAGDKLPNLVFMGMGEPLANYDNTVKSISILLNPSGFNFSHRKITVSTAGLIIRMKEFSATLPVNLAISLNAPNDKIRDFLMPINKKFPIKDLISTVKDCSINPRKRITFEYILIKDINDSPEHARELGKLLKNIPCKINLIPFNEHPEVKFKKPEEKKIKEFQSILHMQHFTAPIRRSKGSDIAAACGQLGGSLGEAGARSQESGVRSQKKQ
jgi:23S rRNA (adenine2503-C2)-methyltransferase